MFYKDGQSDGLSSRPNGDDNGEFPDVLIEQPKTPEQIASEQEQQRVIEEEQRLREENMGRLNYIADILWPKLVDYLQSPYIFVEEDDEEISLPKYPSFEALKQSFDTQDGVQAMQWFEDSGFLEEICNYRSYYFVAKKLFDIFTECLKDYLGSTPYAEVFTRSQWIVHAIAATFSILIIKLNTPSSLSVSNRADLVFEGIPVARWCMYAVMSANNNQGSYEPISVFETLLNQTYNDIFLKKPGDLVQTEDKLVKALDIILLHRSYEGLSTEILNSPDVFIRLFSVYETLEYSYKPLLNDISKTTLIFGIFPVIDTFFSTNTLTQRNSLIDDLYVRINMIWDFLMNKQLASLNTRAAIRQILENIRRHSVQISPRFYKTYSEDILLSEFSKRKSFRQLIYPRLPKPQERPEETQVTPVPEVDLVSTFSRLNYGVLKYILHNILLTLLDSFAREHAIVDPEFHNIIRAYTWKTLHYLMCYFEQPETMQGATPDEVSFFTLINKYISSDFKELSQNDRDELDRLENLLIVFRRPILIPTDWAALISLLISSPLIELRDVLRNRYEQSIDDIYGRIFATIKSFYKSMHEIFLLNNSQTTMFGDLERSLVLSMELENLLRSYYPDTPRLFAEFEAIREQVIPALEISEEDFNHNGLLRTKVWTQSLYNLSLPDDLPEDFERTDFINPDADSEETFSALEVEEFPESLFVMTLLTGNESQIRYIFPFFSHNQSHPLCIDYLKTYEKACSHKEDQK